MITVDSSTKKFIRPELFSFLNDLENAIQEHYEGNPLQIVAEYLTEEDMSEASERELLATLNLSYEAGLVLLASVTNDRDNPNFSRSLNLRIAKIMMTP